MVSGKVTSSARTGRAQRTKPRRAAPRPIVHPVKTRKPDPHQTGAGLSGQDPAASYSPTRRPCSTIGAGGLNGRVRDGNGCFPSAITAGNRITNWTGRSLVESKRVVAHSRQNYGQAARPFSTG